MTFKEEQERQAKAEAKPEAPTSEAPIDQGRKVHNARAPPQPWPAHTSTLWRCCLRDGLDIRPRPMFARSEVRGKVGYGEMIEVTEERPFQNGHGYFLRLSKNRGWVFLAGRRNWGAAVSLLDKAKTQKIIRR